MKKGIVILLSVLMLCSAVYALDSTEYTAEPSYLVSADMPIVTFQCNDGWDNDGDHQVDYYGGCDSDMDAWIDYVCGCDNNFDEEISRNEALTSYDDCFLAEFGCMVDGVFDNSEICEDGNLYWPDPNCTDFIDDKERTLDGEEEADEIIITINEIEPNYPDYREPIIIENVRLIPYFPYFTTEKITDVNVMDVDRVEQDVVVDQNTQVETSTTNIENIQEPIDTSNRGLIGHFVLDVMFDHPLNKLI